MVPQVKNMLTQYKKCSYLFFVFIIALWVSTSYAAVDFGSTTAADIIKNISEQIPGLMRLVTASAYVLGIFFIVLGIIKLKHFGESRTMMSHEHSLKGPLIFIVIGAMLIYLPSAVQMGLSTFWTEPCPYCYEKIGATDQWSDFYTLCYRIIQLVGVIAFIRGLVTLSQMGHHGGHQNTLGKGLTLIIAGILCINIYQFVQMVILTLGGQIS